MEKMLIADDHALVRYGLKVAILEYFPECHVDESSDGISVMEKLKNHMYDLVLLDLSMPKTDPTLLLHWIRNFQQNAKVLVVSMSNENIFGKRSLQLGAHGYIEKDASPEELIKAVRTVLAGRKYMSANLSEIIINDVRDGALRNPFDKLTAREFQVAMFIVQDYSIAQICEKLQLKYTSVCSVRQRVFEKLDIEDRKTLVQLADAYSLF